MAESDADVLLDPVEDVEFGDDSATGEMDVCEGECSSTERVSRGDD